MRRFRKKVRRFVRLYWFWVSLGLVLTKVSVEAAYIERGYKAYGGEWLVLPVVMIVGYFVNEARMYLPDFIEEWREEKAYERILMFLCLLCCSYFCNSHIVRDVKTIYDIHRLQLCQITPGLQFFPQLSSSSNVLQSV